jgi:hypothetical protein
MSKFLIKQNATSVLATIFVQNDSVTTGAGLTGLAYNTSSLTAYYFRQGDSSDTAISLATMTLGTWASGGLVKVDDTNMPGVVQLGLPNACFTALGSVVVYLQGAANMAPCVLEFQVVAFDPTDAVHLGLSSLPNAAAAASGGLMTIGTSTGQVNPDGSGNVPMAMGQALPGSPSANTTGSALVQANTLTFSGSFVKADAEQWKGGTIPSPNVTGVPLVDNKYWLGTIVTAATAGIPDVNAKNINNVSTSSVATINANIGTTQPTNFTGTGASAYVQVDVENWVASAPNVLHAGCVQVDVQRWANDNNAISVNANHYPNIAVHDILGAVSAGAAGYVGPDWGHINAPTTTVDLSGTTIKNLDGNTVQTGDAYAIVNNGTYGNSALHTQIGSPWQVGTKYNVLLNGSDVTGNVPGDLQTIKTQTVTCSAGVTIEPFVGNANHVISVDTSGNVTIGGYASNEDPWSIIKAATPSNTPSAGTVELLLRLLDADWSVDTSTTPWDIVATINGTGLSSGMGGTGTVILRKRARDTGSSNITNTTTVIGQEIQ